MESADTVALYERILTLVGPRELHRSSNDVLQEEFSSLQRAVDDIVTTFAKVEEVRDAVNQLEQVKPSTGRSESLMDVMDRTMGLQKELGQILDKVASGMTVADVTDPEKRRRNGSSDEEEEEETKHKKQKRGTSDEDQKANGSADGKKKSADLYLAHEALKAILEVKTVNKRMQFDQKDKWAEALFDIKRILKRQSSCDAHTTDNPAADVTARALEAAAAVFKNIEWTAEHAKEARSVIAALADACSKNKTLRVYFHRVRAQLESIEMDIPASLTEASANRKSVSTGDSLEHQLRTYHNLVDSTHAQSPGVKPKRILEALSAIQQVMADDSMCVHQIDVRLSVSHVSRWIGETPIQNDLSKQYFWFANGIVDYSKKFPDEQKQVEWQSLATSVLMLLDEKSNPSQPARTVHLQTTTSKKTIEVQGRLTSVLTQVEQWQDGIFSLDQLNKVFKTLNYVVSYKSKEWNPFASVIMRDCLEKLTSCIKMIKKQAHRDKRWKTANKWKARCHKHR